jgi:hypothetical protein
MKSQTHISHISNSVRSFGVALHAELTYYRTPYSGVC